MEYTSDSSALENHSDFDQFIPKNLYPGHWTCRIEAFIVSQSHSCQFEVSLQLAGTRKHVSIIRGELITSRVTSKLQIRRQS